MKKKKNSQSVPEPGEQTPREDEEYVEPERFDHSLLLQPAEVRLDYFENQCIIEHTRLLDSCSKIVNTICSPGEGLGLKRPGKMVLLEKSIVLSIPLETNEQSPDLASKRLFASK